MAYEAVDQVIDQITHVPSAMERPAAAVFLVAATVTSLAYEKWLQHRTTYDYRKKNGDPANLEDYSVESGNPALLEDAINDVTGESVGKKVLDSTWHRLGSRILMASGFALGIGSLIANPTFESSVANRAANVSVVLDASTSMLQSKDLGSSSTRYEASRESLASTDFQGRMAVSIFGKDNFVGVQLSPDWKSQLESDKLRELKSDPNGNPPFDANGGILAETVALGESLLPLSGTVENQRDGTLVIVTDGTVDSKPEELAAQAQALKQQGTHVEVIVTGTPKGSYTLEGSSQPVPSGTNTDLMNAFGSENVTVADTADKVTDSIHSVIHASGTEPHRHSWYPLAAAGALVAFWGWIRGGKQSARNVV